MCLKAGISEEILSSLSLIAVSFLCDLLASINKNESALRIRLFKISSDAAALSD